MPDRISPPRDSHRSLALRVVAAIALSTTAIATSRQPSFTQSWWTVNHIPPDACVALYGPGPCREHGTTIIGSTDAVALWPLPARQPALQRSTATSNQDRSPG